MRFSSNSDKSGNPILSSVGSDSTIKKGRFSCYISRKNDKKLFS